MSLIRILTTMAVSILIPTASFTSGKNLPIPTVDHVDLESYVGLWHEILRVENSFQDNEPAPGEGPCYNTTAEYSSLPKGKIGVKNTCGRKSGNEISIAKA